MTKLGRHRSYWQAFAYIQSCPLSHSTQHLSLPFAKYPMQKSPNTLGINNPNERGSCINPHVVLPCFKAHCSFANTNLLERLLFKDKMLPGTM